MPNFFRPFNSFIFLSKPKAQYGQPNPSTFTMKWSILCAWALVMGATTPIITITIIAITMANILLLLLLTMLLLLLTLPLVLLIAAAVIAPAVAASDIAVGAIPRPSVRLRDLGSTNGGCAAVITAATGIS